METSEYLQKWGWIEHVQSVADLTHKDWDAVWTMNVVEFLNLVCYIKDKREEDKKRIEDYRRMH